MHRHHLRGRERDSGRSSASAILKHVVKVTEEGFAQDPKALETYQKAYTTHIQAGRQFGIGSLASKISRVPNSRGVCDIIDRNNAHLLADFPKEKIAERRSECIQARAGHSRCERGYRLVRHAEAQARQWSQYHRMARADG